MSDTPTTTSAQPAEDRVFDGLELTGRINVPDEQILANIGAAIRRQHPQVCRTADKSDRVALVGSGPSLADTANELVDLVFGGAKLVTVNGSYHWCLERNLKPNAQVVLDARASNARFLEPAVPGCRYYLASQCHPALWDAVEGREHVAIFHGIGEEAGVTELLDGYYGKDHWQPIPGGTTVITRAIGLLRTLGYLRFDLFGVDSCWMPGPDGTPRHHAFDQPENEKDRLLKIHMHPTGHPELERTFECAPWHLKQLEDLVQMVRINGHAFMLNVHGDGAFAYALQSAAELVSVEAA